MASNSKKIPESKLIPIIKHFRNLIAPNTDFDSVEVESGYGIADVVFYSLDENSIENRVLKSELSRLKSYEILETLSFLNTQENNEIAVTQLYQNLPFSEKYFKSKLLPFLIKNEICQLEKNDYLNCLWKYKVALKETVAIEAKVSNWRRGLYQAYRYRQYADLSYLALESNYIRPALQNIQDFHKANVGLIKVDSDNDNIEILYTPNKESKMRSKMLEMYTNEFILQEKNFIE